VPETQFGFYPQRDTMQPSFMLRHICHAAKWAHTTKRQASSRVYAAFMDFTQAYDKVKRVDLWQHLARINMPSYMLDAIRGMYTGDSYILVDGGRRTSPISPTLGVKQGCPLSPLLFALFINDFENRAGGSLAHGIPLLNNPARVVSHMFYADDLVLLSYRPSGLQFMLDDLKRYSERKGLVVNAGKSKIVVFNSVFSSAREMEFRYAGQPLEVVEEFKYLGIVFRGSPQELSRSHMQAPWARALIGATRRTLNLAQEFGVKKSVWAVLRLFQSYALSTGMYGCQVWGTRYAHLDEAFTSDVARRHMCFLKRTAGVARSTPNWAVLAELNCKPYHYYWIRALLKFHKSLLSCNSPLLHDVVKADAWLASQVYGSGSRARRCDNCWSAEFAAGLCSIADVVGDDEKRAAWAAAVRGANVVDSAAVMQTVQAAYDVQAWKGCSDIPDVRVSNLVAADGTSVGRKFVTYHAWFKLQQPGLPSFLWSPVTKHKLVKNMLRFRLGSHSLGCNLGRQMNPMVPWAERLCTRCSEAHRSALACAVDDEYHAIFECEAFEHLRDSCEVRTMIAGAARDVRTFMLSGSSGNVMKYISSLMDTVDAAIERGSPE
jgi:hypothetical protein